MKIDLAEKGQREDVPGRGNSELKAQRCETLAYTGTI